MPMYWVRRKRVSLASGARWRGAGARWRRPGHPLRSVARPRPARRRQSAVPSSAGHRVVPGNPRAEGLAAIRRWADTLRRRARMPGALAEFGARRRCGAIELRELRQQRRHVQPNASPGSGVHALRQAAAEQSCELVETLHVARLQVGGKPLAQVPGGQSAPASVLSATAPSSQNDRVYARRRGIALDYLPEMWRRDGERGEFSPLSGCRPEACGPIAQLYEALAAGESLRSGDA